MNIKKIILSFVILVICLNGFISIVDIGFPLFMMALGILFLWSVISRKKSKCSSVEAVLEKIIYEDYKKVANQNFCYSNTLANAIFSYEYNGKKYYGEDRINLISDNIIIGNKRELYININDPTEIIHPKKEKNNKFAFLAAGISFIIISIVFIIMSL